jgi:enoyl-CoA hydratase
MHLPPAVTSQLSADGILTVTLHRPHRKNAVDGPTARELYRCFQEFDANPLAKAAVLYGEGGTFCAGADLAELAAGGSTNPVQVPVGQSSLGPMGPTRMLLSKPVIAAVEGFAVAGGLELAIWCDLRVVSEQATFGVYCRRFGVPLIDGGTVRLPRLVGHSRAMDLILTGRAVGAQEALQMGLANRVVPAGQTLAHAQQLALQIASFPQDCMCNDRRSACEQWGLDETQALLNEFALGPRCDARVKDRRN